MNPVATFLLFQGLFVVSRTQLDEFCCDIFLFFQGHNWMNSVAIFFIVSRIFCCFKDKTGCCFDCFQDTTG